MQGAHTTKLKSCTRFQNPRLLPECMAGFPDFRFSEFSTVNLALPGIQDRETITSYLIYIFSGRAS